MSSNTIRAYAAKEPHSPLVPYEFDAGELTATQVEIDVEYCGLCHSDISILNNDWGVSSYPVVAGHEVIGKVSRLGSEAKGLKIGQRVGLGWNAESCGFCDPCIGGEQVLCTGEQKATIVDHAGGFANKVRAGWQWAIPLPDDIDIESAGPLLCGGVTVFTPLLLNNITALHHVGVIGIGGLGHIALKLLKAWGCEVTAFTSNLDKTEQLKGMGADHVINSKDPEALKALSGKFDLILSTVNVPLDWANILTTVAPKGAIHYVGVPLEPVSVPAFSLISGGKALTGSKTGSPIVLRQLLKFAARKNIKPQIELYPMSKINEAIEHLEAGKARYRVVLKADFE
ncbi:NAD(P)-dependent alcohol dehydrogenase [Acinetobacter apis]|uniref:alcohol dehydrogenase (NADP(+)) n=1 Tax=Acinetobacter apis TaxID=1229165 RepID=A0A217EFC9_9GAMM|nr:NAD(P)-dependent alcohol dehydrogenase [Acinetobacter apis]SNQ29012.1 uncharacterized zinc-type alcohol dehydrogenase-like protein [Acinetobacter apis]